MNAFKISSSAYAISSKDENPELINFSAISSLTERESIIFAKNSVSSTFTFASASSLLIIFKSHPTNLEASLIF